MKRVLVALLLASCSFGQPNHERLGDLAWHDGRWAEAMLQYRAAGDSPRLTAKLADAALQAGSLTDAVQAFTKLGVDAPDRSAEAAAGLQRVADVAEHDGKDAALAQAVAGLRRIAPNWPVARLASRIQGASVVPPDAMADVIPAILAANPGREAAEPLLLALGQFDRSRGACQAGIPILEGVIRRAVSTGARDTATSTVGWCELGLGMSALQLAHAAEAEVWLERATRRDPNAVYARRANVGLGDARLAQGDTASARLAWQTLVVPGTEPDSLMQVALLRLQSLLPPVVPDSGTAHPVFP